MNYYLLQIAYTSQAWAAMVKNPHSREAAVRAAVEKLGGKIDRFWMAFGDYDIVGVIQMPDNLNAAAFSIAVGAGGACKAVKTTPLLTVEEGIAAMHQAAACGYKPAGAGA